MSRSPEAPRECANCGASIPRGAKACPECGADEHTGWRESSVYDGLDLPNEAFEDEAGSEASPRREVNGIAWYWWLVAAVMLFLLAGGGLLLRR